MVTLVLYEIIIMSTVMIDWAFERLSWWLRYHNRWWLMLNVIDEDGDYKQPWIIVIVTTAFLRYWVMARCWQMLTIKSFWEGKPSQKRYHLIPLWMKFRDCLQFWPIGKPEEVESYNQFSIHDGLHVVSLWVHLIILADEIAAWAWNNGVL